MRNLSFLLFFLVSTQLAAQSVSQVRVQSPNKSTELQMSIRQGALQYRILFGQKVVVDWSPLGLELQHVSTNEKVKLRTTKTRIVRESFSWPLGENDQVNNHYNELSANLSSSSSDFQILVRAYDGSVAFRYKLPAGKEATFINKEETSFRFSQPVTIYQYNEESVFTPKLLDTLSNSCDFPATLVAPGLYLSIGEADNYGYTKAELVKGPAPSSLALTFPRDSIVALTDGLTPWRTVSISKTAIGLHQFSQLYLKLASNPIDKIPGWIRPGKLIRSQLSTQSGIDCIDFAAAHQFQYIMFDAGWYGAEFRGSSDPTQPIPELDMQKVIEYGKQKGVGVILYVNYVGLKQKLDTILPVYKKWGVAGLKFGFVDGLTQQGIQWLNTAIKKVYNYGLILNIHDNYKPTGLSRAYPQLLTQEGIRGDENSPDAFHNTTLPFTRFLAGPADFTFCYPNATNSYSKNIKVSMAQQLALSVVYFSPLQSVFWYGKPKEYTNEEEIEFFKFVPTVWNESYYLAGEIGKNVSVARRHGSEWFIGNITGFQDWKSNIRLDFLPAGKTFTAIIYEDENNSIRKRQITVKKGDLFRIDIKAKGGQAIILR